MTRLELKPTKRIGALEDWSPQEDQVGGWKNYNMEPS